MYDCFLNRLEVFLEKDAWNGYDPYDGLNSPFLKALTFNRKWLRIAAIQFMKRAPINLRPLFGVPKTKNPKALGLLANGYLIRYRNGHKEKYLTKAQEILDWLIANSSAGYSGYCWGYSFNWQSSVFYIPKGVPTIVNTAFVANAFLDAYEITRDKCYLDVARSACDFILRDLNRTGAEGKGHGAKGIGHKAEGRGHGAEGIGQRVKRKDNKLYQLNQSNEYNEAPYPIIGGDSFCFSYSPLDAQCVHNANLFAAELLARVYHFTGEENLRRPAESSLAFSVSCQNPDGSWYYGNSNEETYVDSFHTGFVLVSLLNIVDYMDMTNKNEFKRILLKGYEYYKKTFFNKEGMPYYYSNSSYPIDLHCSAQGIITLLKFSEFDRDAISMARAIADWAMKNMWDDKDGCFYFQRTKLLTNKASYFRWPNVWMYYALATLALHRA